MEPLKYALKDYGVKEVPGKQHSVRVLEYLKLAGFDDKIKDDETAWCSTFANAMCALAGYERSNSAAARSWLKVGEETDCPEPGDIVVFERGPVGGWQGHVAFYITETESHVYVLGGNQNNQVNISPYAKNRLLGYRKIKPL